MSKVQIESKVVQLPPSYDEAAKSHNTPASGVRPSDVTTHLKLLFAFAKLREHVMNDASIFDLDDSWLDKGQGVSDAITKARHLIAEKRWDIYVRRAAMRFEYWWSTLRTQINGKKITIRDLTYSAPISLSPPPQTAKLFINESNLPPLDVLMVWHSFLLSPRRYLEDCLLQGMMPLWHSEFPWAAIDQAIDPLLESGSYTPSTEAETTFSANAPWANEDDQRSSPIQCPQCFNNQVRLRCTTFPDTLKSIRDPYLLGSLGDETLVKHIEAGLRNAEGWADPAFVVKCSTCRFPINKNVLCAQKFKNDIMRFSPSTSSTTDRQYVSTLEKCVPMPGTVLNSRTGLPQTTGSIVTQQCLRSHEFFPNMMAGTLCHVDSDGQPNQTIVIPSDMSGVRSMLEQFLSCRDQMLYLTDKRQRRAHKHQRPTIRRMMACYNDNPSPFTMDLASAVHRQANFIHKMQQIDWLHSPALSLTAERVIIKYQRFMAVIAGNPKDMAVPTLDVDLAWHTHQLTPYYYTNYTYTSTGKFVDHDDKISEHKISESFARTSKNYQRMFNEPYSECTCWYCEAIHASVSSFPGRFILPGRTTGYRRPEHAGDDHSTAHISTHNAVKIQNSTALYQRQCREHLRWLDKAYQRACDRAKKEGRAPPQKRHRAVNAGQYYPYAGYDGLGPGVMSGKGLVNGKGLALGVGAGAGLLAVGAYAIAIDDEGIGFEGNPEVVEGQRNTGSGGCVSGACGGGVAWGGCSNDAGGATGACGGSGGSCSGGGSSGGGGCGSSCGGGCGGCGGG